MTTDLGEVLGTVLASLAHARRIADEETATIAEHYRETSLLEGMSLPRVRVPEMVVEVPVLLEAYRERKAGVPAPPARVVDQARKELARSASAEGVRLPKTFLDAFERDLKAELASVGQQRGQKPLLSEPAVRAVDDTLRRVLERDATPRFTPTQSRALRGRVRRKIRSLAAQKPPEPSSLAVSVLTSEVKERSAPENVARLRVTLREEGLEWSVSERSDGGQARTLTPE